jgi:hypothetical protein
MKELQMIENSGLRDEYVRQVLLDRILYPIEKAQHDIQDTAKHAQWLAQVIVYYHQDHGLTEEQAHELAKQLKLLAIHITYIDSLRDLKFAYAVATTLADRISVFKHKELKYRIDYSMRENVLNRLNTCIATGNNFKIREELMKGYFAAPSAS